MKKALYLLFILTSFMSAAQQTDQKLLSKEDIERMKQPSKEGLDRGAKIVKEAPYIFDGEVIEIKTYDTYNCSYIVEIKEVYKGSNKIKKGTVELIGLGMLSPQGFPMNNSAISTMGVGARLTFVCKDETREKKCSDTDNKIAITPYLSKEIGFGKTSTTFFEYEGFEALFTTKDDFYMWLGEQLNMKIENPDSKKKGLEESVGSLNKSNRSYQNNVDSYDNFIKSVYQLKINQNSNRSSVNCDDLFISEYTHGSQKNKAIEIYNPTDNPVDLTDYTLQIFNNGAPTPLDIPLTGNIQPKETHVIAHPNASTDVLNKAEQTDVKLNFDGNDAIVLKRGQSTYLDKIGEIGVNPGSGGWAVPPGSTKQHTLRRKYPIEKGQQDWNVGKNEWDVYPEDNFSNLKTHTNACATATASNDLHFEIANPNIIAGTPKTFEFDVMVSDNSGTHYLDNCLLRIQYNSTAFGNNVVANNKISVTKGSLFDDITYSDPDTMIIDQTTNAVGIPFGTYYDENKFDGATPTNIRNRTLVSTSLQQLLHVQIEFTDCGEQTELLFIDQSDLGLYSFYTLTPNEGVINSLSYDNTTFGSGLDVNLCELIISGFTPSEIGAGTHEIVTISGSGFGNTKGIVALQETQEGNGSILKDLEDYDIVSWTDTEIKITVPSISLDPNPSNNWIAGKGQIYIENILGGLDLTTTNLQVPYTIINTKHNLPVDQKLIKYLGAVNDSGGYTLYLDTSIANHPIRKAVTKKAIKDWVCSSNINWTISDSVVALHKDSLIKFDGFSVISYAPFEDDSALAITQPWAIICDDPSNLPNKLSYIDEIDLRITSNIDVLTGVNNATWSMDTMFNSLQTNELDFYGTVLHELGHAHSLDHVNINSDLMYYSNDFGEAAVDRDFITGDAQNGALWIINKSANVVFSTDCSGWVSPFNPKQIQCTGPNPTEVREMYLASNNIMYYPNPSNSIINLEYDVNINSYISFKLLDMTGKIVWEYNQPQLPIGHYKQSIDLSTYTNGIYFLSSNVNGKWNTDKLVKW